MDAQILSLEPPAALVDRRGFLAKTALTAGFCAAVEPVWAQVVQTSAEGLVAGEVRVPSSGADLPAYHAMPAVGGPFPTVLVINEIFGVHEHMKDVCRRFAKAGHYAIATDFFARAGDASSYTDTQKLLAEIVNKTSDAQVAGDVDATLAFAKGTGKADASRTAIAGFCWGGRQVWLNAARHPEWKAGVAWYGHLAGPTNDMKPKNPLDLAATITVPVLGLYGGKDPGITPEQVNAMQKELQAAGRPSKIITYPDAPHGFHADYRPSYRKADAEDSWNNALAWLKEHGAG